MRRDEAGVYESHLLAALSWLEHGFGTRNSRDWPGAYTYLKQIHSANVVAVEGRHGFLGEGDALITSDAHEWIGIRTADCIPILLADPGIRAIAAVHAGWRGTAAEIARRTVEAMKNRFQAAPEKMIAAIGPGIGVCCYEVGGEVRAKFPQFAQDGKVDLIAANRAQLESAGLLAANIDAAALCTACNPELFHSYRRDRDDAGRMVAAIRVKTPSNQK